MIRLFELTNIVYTYLFVFCCCCLGEGVLSFKNLCPILLSILAIKYIQFKAVFPDQVNGTNRSQDQCVKNGLTIGMKRIRQHMA
jgi:hypothetical protein